VTSKRLWHPALPAMLAGSLLAIVAAAPRASSRGPALPSAVIFGRCDLLLQQSGGSSEIVVPPLGGLNQPIGTAGNVAACSLAVRPTNTYYSTGRLDLVQWDPAALAPDPTTIALRTRAFTASDMALGRTRADFYPPVVTQSITGVAEPPRPTIAIDWLVIDRFNSHTVKYEADGAPEIPAVLQYPPGGGARTPLPGAHPVLSHYVCGGDDALQRLSVIQSVVTTNTISDTSCFDLLQRFRVPVRSRLQWVEVAFGVPPRPQFIDPIIAILDAGRADEPPVVLPPSLVEAPFAYFVNTPFWGSHYDFDRLIVLEPGRDYWLLARVEKQYVLYSRTLTGSEGPDFAAGIGPYFRRTTPTGAWIAEPGRALCFKLIGEPQEQSRDRSLPRGRHRDQRLGEAPPPRDGGAAVAQTPREAMSPAPLLLRVAPNPARGSAFVSWTGARGPLRVDVHDAQGRRVSGATHDAGADGQWLWRGAREDGRPLPAGVYFVRVSDGAGRFASDRVVLIR
jgi:hypothetical protein